MSNTVLGLDQIQCVACGACYSVCPQACIAMQENADGFFYPSIDIDSCVQCGKCVSVCQIVETNKNFPQNFPVRKVYGAWVKNREERKAGSSGGIFGALASFVVQRGGVVFGAAFDGSSGMLCHTSTEKCPLEKMKKSKYVESYMGDVCRQIECLLKRKVPVLFCGTPCQVKGVQLFCHEHREFLFLCDLVCHGVPPQKLLRKYLSELNEKVKGKVVSVEFRSKELGWRAYCMKGRMENARYYLSSLGMDPYLKAFLYNNCLRESCYGCNRLEQSSGDITLGDFWNLPDKYRTKESEKGTSLVCVNTEKGASLFSEVRDDLYCFSVPTEAVLYAYKPRPNDRKNRREFFDALNAEKIELFHTPLLPSVSAKDRIRDVKLKLENGYGFLSWKKVFMEKRKKRNI